MALVNVNRKNADPFYRYKMPKIAAKVEGKGNGIKTVIVNMVEVAKALHRPAEYPTKYFGCELGAQTQFDVKNERYIVNGSHDSSKLQDLLDDFIKRFVLCQECDNPETNLVIKKGMITQRCMACGHTGNIDMCHKLTTYILKCPPPAEDNHGTNNTPNKKTVVPKTGKKEKTKKKETNGTNQMNGDHKENDVDEEVSQKENNEDDLDWGEDVSDEAVKARMHALSSAARNMTIDEDLEKSEHERIDIFYNYLKKKKENNYADASDKDVFAEAERLNIIEKAPMVMVEIFFDENILTQLKTFRKYFIRFTYDNKKAQKNILSGLEILVGKVHYEALINKVIHILKLIYDCDIIDEEVLLEWHSKQSSKKIISKEIAAEIRIKTLPFIKWLKEAEEEESSDESDDDLEIVYDKNATVGVETVKKPVTSNDKGEDVDDDFDIDAI